MKTSVTQVKVSWTQNSSVKARVKMLVRVPAK